MSNNNDKTETLRELFAKGNKPVVLARPAEMVVVNTEPLAEAYFKGNVLKYEGKPVSPVQECRVVQSPSKQVIYAAEKGFSPIGKGENEAVELDQTKINRMGLSMGVSARQQGGRI